MTAKQVSEQLGIRQFLALCATVDMTKGEAGQKFEVVKIEKQDTVIRILVLVATGEIHDLKIAA